MQRLQMRLPGSNGNRVLISSVTTPDTLRAESTGYIKIMVNERVNKSGGGLVGGVGRVGVKAREDTIGKEGK